MEDIFGTRLSREFIDQRRSQMQQIAQEVRDLETYSPPPHRQFERSYVTAEEAVGTLGLLENHRRIATEMVESVVSGKAIMDVAKEARAVGFPRHALAEMIRRATRMRHEAMKQRRVTVPVAKSLESEDSLVKANRRQRKKTAKKKATPAAKSGNKPPSGFSSIPNSKKGGYRKREGAGYTYWYPGQGVSQSPHDDEHGSVHEGHAQHLKEKLSEVKAKLKPSPEVHAKYMELREKGNKAGIAVHGKPTGTHTIQHMNSLEKRLDAAIAEHKKKKAAASETKSAESAVSPQEEIKAFETEAAELGSMLSDLKSSLGDVHKMLSEQTEEVKKEVKASKSKKDLKPEDVKVLKDSIYALRHMVTGVFLGLLAGGGTGAFAGLAGGSARALGEQKQVRKLHKDLMKQAEDKAKGGATAAAPEAEPEVRGQPRQEPAKVVSEEKKEARDKEAAGGEASQVEQAKKKDAKPVRQTAKNQGSSPEEKATIEKPKGSTKAQRSPKAEERKASKRKQQKAGRKRNRVKKGIYLDLESGGLVIVKAESYTVPASARGNARKVLAWKEKHGTEVRGMTSVGWARARQLASQKSIGIDTVKRMSAFNRHRKNAAIDPKHTDEPWKDAGYVAWLGWGGTTGVDWARGITGALTKAEKGSTEHDCKDHPEQTHEEWETEQTMLEKGARHKYIKRVPTGNKKRPWKYVYKIEHAGGVFNTDHMHVGSKFSASGGHYHVAAKRGDQLLIRHDETGETKSVTKKELHKLLVDEHADAIVAHKDKMRARLAKYKPGSYWHRRVEKQLKVWDKLPLEQREHGFRDPKAVLTSKSFKDWFGNWTKGEGSKVVDTVGVPEEQFGQKPTKMFHGTPVGGFRSFSKDKDKGQNIFGRGFYFTADRSIADEYTHKDEDENIYSATGWLDSSGKPITTLSRKEMLKVIGKAGFSPTEDAGKNGWHYDPDPNDPAGVRKAHPELRPHGNNDQNAVYAAAKASDNNGNVDVKTFLKYFWNPAEEDVAKYAKRRDGIGNHKDRGISHTWMYRGLREVMDAKGATPVIPDAQVFEVYLNVRNPIDMESEVSKEQFDSFARETIKAEIEKSEKSLQYYKDKVKDGQERVDNYEWGDAWMYEGTKEDDRGKAPKGKVIVYHHHQRTIVDPKEIPALIKQNKEEDLAYVRRDLDNSKLYLSNAEKGLSDLKANLKSKNPTVASMYLKSLAPRGESPSEPRGYDKFLKLKKSLLPARKIEYDDNKRDYVTTKDPAYGILHLTDENTLTFGDLHYLMSDGHSDFHIREKFTEWAQSQGHDGIRHTGGWNIGTKEHDVWIAFEPNQIKATNAATFNSDTDDIYKAVFIGPRGGKWADAKHTIPWKKEEHHAELIAGFKTKVGADDFGMYYDVASGTSPEGWHAYVGKYGYTPAQSEKLRTAIVQQEKGQQREQAKASFARNEALAFGGVDFASGVVPTIHPQRASIRVSGEVTKAGNLFGGLEAKYPVVRKLVAAGLIKGIVPYKGGSKKSGHEANYNPKTREIEVNNPNVNAGTLLHEVGHALEEAAPDGWMHGAGWGAEQPSGSQYAAAGDPSEQFAEAFVHMIAGDAVGFYEHAPKQAKTVTVAHRALTSLSKAVFIGPRGGKWADAKHTIPWKKEEAKPTRKAPGSQLPKKTQERLKALGVKKLPEAAIPAKDIVVDFTNPDTTAMIKWRDRKGRMQSGYTPEFHKANAAKKWERVAAFREKSPAIIKDLQKKLKGSEAGSVEQQGLLVANIVALTGLRPGSSKSLEGRFGVSTLQPQHLKISGNRVSFEFVGKQGKVNTASFTNKTVADALRDYTDSTEGQSMFSGQALTKARASLPSGMKLKDFRTIKATNTAFDVLDAVITPPPLTGDRAKDKKLLAKALLSASKEVAKVINNTPSVARASYVHPEVFRQWAIERAGADPKLFEEV